MMAAVSISSNTQQKLYFVGVTTEESSIMKLFPRWVGILGLDAEIVGYDLPLGATADAYRDCVRQLAGDSTVSGALVTTHKAGIFDHAGDLFTHLDRNARLCREVSCVARRPEGLVGSAKDPITAGLALDHLIGPAYWAERDADAVCLGAGGAGLAIVVRLLTQAKPPRRVVLVDRNRRRLELARTVYGELHTDGELRTLHHLDVADTDRLVSGSRPGSLVINATGMGKDVPGSPISAAAEFPPESIAWDLNYRGRLEFLSIAASQPAASGVRVADGWRYFLHGWTEVISDVFQIELTAERFAELAAASESPGSLVSDQQANTG